MVLNWIKANKGYARATAGLTLYLAWLNGVALEGVLLPDRVGGGHLHLFLSVHVVALFLGPWVSPSILSGLTRYGFCLLGLLSVSLLAVASHTAFLFMAMGVVAAPLVIHCLNTLRQVTSPMGAAAVALILGNLVPRFLCWAPLELTWKLGCMGALLCTLGPYLSQEPLAFYPKPIDRLKAAHALDRRFWSVYLLLTVFYITGGIMHGYLAPALAQAGDTSYVYILAYLGMVALSPPLLKRSHDASIYLAVVLGVVCFSLVAFDGLFFRRVSLFFSHASFGVFDLLVIALVVAPNRDIFEQYRLMGAMCGGILLGSVVVALFAEHLAIILVVAHVVLVMTLALFSHLKVLAVVKREHAKERDASLDFLATVVSRPFLKRVSAKERAVLTHVVKGCTYKEVAQRENISESTVKTHMQRIFVKFECRNRKELLAKLLASVEKTEC